MSRRGRPPGGRGSGAKIADELVPHIREAYAAGCTTGELAAELGVRPDTVAYCVRGKTFRDLGGPISTGKRGPRRARNANGRSKLDEARELEIRASAARGETVRRSQPGTAFVTGRSARSRTRSPGGTLAMSPARPYAVPESASPGRRPAVVALEIGAGLGTLNTSPVRV